MRLAPWVIAAGIMLGAPSAALAGGMEPPGGRTVDDAACPLTSFAALTSDAALIGHCVTVEGVAVGGVLAADGDARYVRERRLNDPSSSGAVVGLLRDPVDRPMRVRVRGRLIECAQTPGRGATMGYCDVFRGRAIAAPEVTPLGDARLVRMLPGARHGDLGNLAPLAAGELHDRMAAAAARYLNALHAGDRRALADLHGGGDGSRSPTEVSAMLRLMLDAPDTPFVALRAADPATVHVALFGWKPPLWADAAWTQEAARAGDDAIACFSVRADADALWPIDSKDADNLAGRPYACTWMHIDGTGADSPASFFTDQAVAGAEEP